MASATITPTTATGQNILSQNEQAAFHAWRSAQEVERAATDAAWKARERAKPQMAERPLGQRKLIALLLSVPAAPLMWLWVIRYDIAGYVILSLFFSVGFIALGMWAAHEPRKSALFSLLDMRRRRLDKLDKKRNEAAAETKVRQLDWNNATHALLRKHGLPASKETFVVKNGIVWLLDENREVIVKPYVLPEDQSLTVVDDNGQIHKLSERTSAIINGTL